MYYVLAFIPVLCSHHWPVLFICENPRKSSANNYWALVNNWAQAPALKVDPDHSFPLVSFFMSQSLVFWTRSLFPSAPILHFLKLPILDHSLDSPPACTTDVTEVGRAHPWSCRRLLFAPTSHTDVIHSPVTRGFQILKLCLETSSVALIQPWFRFTTNFSTKQVLDDSCWIYTCDLR